MNKSLAEMQAQVTAWCERKGWKGPDAPAKTFGDCMALLHSEVSEAVEAYRSWGLKDATERRDPKTHKWVEGDQSWCKSHGWAGPCPSDQCPLPKPEGVGSEFADILIRLLDDCDRYGIDLEAEYERKMDYNETRAYRHGGRRL